MKKLAVCMLAYNTEKYISAAVESYLAQVTNFETELIISDDHSTDHTLQIALDYQNKWPGKINVFRHTENVGLANNFISVLRKCNAEYVAFLDSDDIWCDPFKLQKQIDFLDTHPDYGVVFTDCRVIGEDGSEIFWQEMNNYRQLFRSGNLFFHLLTNGGIIPMLTTCFRKKLIDEELEKDDLWYFEDWWLWMRLAIKTRIFYLDEKTSAYRRRQNSITEIRFVNPKVRQEYLNRCFFIYYSNIHYFSLYNKVQVDKKEAAIIFGKVLMLLNRLPGWGKEKRSLIPLLFKYYPGFRTSAALMLNKIRHVTSDSN